MTRWYAGSANPRARPTPASGIPGKGSSNLLQQAFQGILSTCLRTTGLVSPHGPQLAKLTKCGTSAEARGAVGRAWGRKGRKWSCRSRLFHLTRTFSTPLPGGGQDSGHSCLNTLPRAAGRGQSAGSPERNAGLTASTGDEIQMELGASDPESFRVKREKTNVAKTKHHVASVRRVVQQQGDQLSRCAQD